MELLSSLWSLTLLDILRFLFDLERFLKIVCRSSQHISKVNWSGYFPKFVPFGTLSECLFDSESLRPACPCRSYSSMFRAAWPLTSARTQPFIGIATYGIVSEVFFSTPDVHSPKSDPGIFPACPGIGNTFASNLITQYSTASFVCAVIFLCWIPEACVSLLENVKECSLLQQ